MWRVPPGIARAFSRKVPGRGSPSAQHCVCPHSWNCFKDITLTWPICPLTHCTCRWGVLLWFREGVKNSCHSMWVQSSDIPVPSHPSSWDARGKKWLCRHILLMAIFTRPGHLPSCDRPRNDKPGKQPLGGEAPCKGWELHVRSWCLLLNSSEHCGEAVTPTGLPVTHQQWSFFSGMDAISTLWRTLRGTLTRHPSFSLYVPSPLL
jgi:hypothetical protein